MGLKNLFKKSHNKDSSARSTKPALKTRQATSKPNLADTSIPKPAPLSNSNRQVSSTATHSNSISSRQTRRSTISEQKKISSIPTSFLRQSNTLSSLQYKRLPTRSTSSSSLSAIDPVGNTNSLPDELIPIVTLIHAQQARSYVEMFVQVPIAEDDWLVVSAKLSGTELAIWEMDDMTAQERRNDDNGGFKPIYINISDSEFLYEKATNDLTIQLTNSKSYKIRFATKEDIDYFYSNLLLAQFEYKQLQESFTGALLSSKAIHFSDIRTLLAPNNKYPKEEWAVVRFPFLNDKWIRCYVVASPPTNKKKHGKIELFTNSNKSKKALLASLVNIRSCSSVYPENPDFINTNSLLRLTGENYINEELLLKVINGEVTLESSGGGGSRSRSSSIGLRKKKSQTSLLSVSNLNRNSPNHSRNPSYNKSHSRQESQISNLSGNKKLNNATLIQTHLCYIIPETHHGVQPVETMIRLMIPIMNSFQLYGRPDRFISSREDRNSLLFGLPQLPHTQYLDNEISYQLVTLNIENSLNERWNNSDWFQVFKEMCFFKIEKGWVGAGNLVDTFKEGMIYNKERFDEMNNYEYDDYNPEEDFIDFSVEMPMVRNGSSSGNNASRSINSSPAMKNLASLGLGNTGARASTPPIDEYAVSPAIPLITPTGSPQLEHFPGDGGNSPLSAVAYKNNTNNSPLAATFNGNQSAESVYSSQQRKQHQPPAIIIGGGTPNTTVTNDSADSFYHDSVTGASPLIGGGKPQPQTQPPQPKYLAKSNNPSQDSSNGPNNFSFESVYSSSKNSTSGPASIAQARMVRINQGQLGAGSQLQQQQYGDSSSQLQSQYSAPQSNYSNVGGGVPQQQYFSSSDSVNNYVNPHNNDGYPSSSDLLSMSHGDNSGGQVGHETPDSDYDDLSSGGVSGSNAALPGSGKFGGHPVSPISEVGHSSQPIVPIHGVVGYGNEKNDAERIVVNSVGGGKGASNVVGNGGVARHQYRSLIDKVEA